MPDTTTTYALPFPTDAEAPNGPAQIGALAEALDSIEWDLGSLTEAIQQALIPTGTALPTFRSTAPAGFVLCEGQEVSRTADAYKALYEAIGTVGGVGNGTTTFNVPDLRGRVPVGVDGSAGRLSANDALGNTGGAEKHKLAESELPAHGHGSGTLQLEHPTEEATQKLPNQYNPGSPQGGWWAVTGWTNASYFGIKGSTANAGGNGSHNNMPPYQVVSYMIKL